MKNLTDSRRETDTALSTLAAFNDVGGANAGDKKETKREEKKKKRERGKANDFPFREFEFTIFPSFVARANEWKRRAALSDLACQRLSATIDSLSR